MIRPREWAVRIALETNRRQEFIDVTARVREAVADSGVMSGAALVFCPHTTAAVTINENADPDVTADLAEGLDAIAPRDAGWRHVEGNSDGHVKSSLVGPSVLIPIEEGRLALGTWQAVYFCEFDGPRSRTLHVSVLPG